MSKILLYLTLILGITTSAAQLSAHDNETEHNNLELEAKSNKFFETLIINDYDKAFGDLLSDAVLINSDKSLINRLVSQTKIAIQLFGNISKCNLAKQETFTELMHSQIYICQHTNYITRWDIIYGDTSNGWSVLQISFTDKVSEYKSSL